MKTTTLASVLITLAAGSALAAAPATTTPSPTPNMPMGQHGGMGGDHRGPGGHMFEEIDTNHDGFISKEEWTAKGDKMFSDLDANHDGKISQDEMKVHHDMMRAKWEQHKAEKGESLPQSGIKTPAANSAPKN